METSNTKTLVTTDFDNCGFEWIKGYEGLYIIDKTGAIISVPRVTTFEARGEQVERPTRARFIRDADDQQGYRLVVLQKDGKAKSHRVHRLVAETFLEVPEHLKGTKYVVNHIDEVKDNNNLDNLEWVSYSGNANHSKAWLRKSSQKVT
jgi:hypothetical protein